MIRLKNYLLLTLITMLSLTSLVFSQSSDQIVAEEMIKEFSKAKVEVLIELTADISVNSDFAEVDNAKAGEKLALKLHDQIWRPGFQAENGMKHRYKAIPATAILANETAEMTEARLRKVGARTKDAGYKNFRITDGVLEQNINIRGELLVPELNNKLNKAVAVDYIKAIKKAYNPNLSFEANVANAGSGVHEAWMKGNGWKLNGALKALGEIALGNDATTQEMKEVAKRIIETRGAELNKDAGLKETIRQFLDYTELSVQEKVKDTKIVMEGWHSACEVATEVNTDKLPKKLKSVKSKRHHGKITTKKSARNNKAAKVKKH
jgi:hypothetical protein